MENEKITFQSFARIHLGAVILFLLVSFGMKELDSAVAIFSIWILISTLICLDPANLGQPLRELFKEIKSSPKFYLIVMPLIFLFGCFITYFYFILVDNI